MSGLTFYPSSHRYKLDGSWVPGVTTILGVLNKPALTKWAATSVAEYVADNQDAVDGLYGMGRASMVAALKEVPWTKRDTAAARGTAFHEFAERIGRGEEVEVPEGTVPLVEAALSFLEDWRIETVLAEKAVGSREWRYAGTFDLIARYVNPVTGEAGVGVFDWKSSRRVYASTAFQNAAYAFAEFYSDNDGEHPVPEVGASFGVHVREDGYDVLPLRFGPDIFDEFLTIRRAYDINKRAEGDWKTPGSGYVGIPLAHEETA
jgi:hypothetical protein